MLPPMRYRRRESEFMTLDVSIVDRVAFITLNRPEAMNAIDPGLRAQLKQAWRQIDDDEEILVAVLTGSGDKAFCAGSDLKKTPPPATSEASTAFGTAGSDHLLDGLDTDKPIICAVNGYAIGAGLEIALACDIRIAADHAKFGSTEARIGSIPGAGGTQTLPRVVGQSMAMHMMLTAELIDSETALRCGLVSEVVPGEELAERASDLATRVRQNAPLSVRAIKRLVTRGRDMPLKTGLEVERFVWGLLRDSDDRAEGRRAFQEKRPPEYRGK
jgi:E-phenylitaconyl-CoA hydratase